MIQWAANQTAKYIQSQLVGELTDEDVIRICREATSAYKQVKDDAANIGTVAHDWLEKHLKGEVQELPDNPEAALSCNAAMSWLDNHNWELLVAEQPIYSPTYNFAGTLDWVGLIDGKLSLLDWKTSKHIYSSHRYQTAAYNIAAEELEPALEIEQRIILRIDKETGEFVEADALIMPRTELEADFSAFKAALTIYKREAELRVRKPRI